MKSRNRLQFSVKKVCEFNFHHNCTTLSYTFGHENGSQLKNFTNNFYIKFYSVILFKTA